MTLAIATDSNDTGALVTEGLADASTALVSLRNTTLAPTAFRSYAEALAASKLNFEVEAVPLSIGGSDEGWNLARGIRRKDFTPVPGTKTDAVERRQLGTVGRAYHIVQNLGVAQALDDLMAPLGGVQVATVARTRAYDGGRICSMFLDLPPALSNLLNVRRDGSDRSARIVGKWSHDGSISVVLNASVFRKVCENGLIVETNLVPTFKLKHTSGAQQLSEKMKAWLGVVGAGLKEMGNLSRQLDAKKVDATATREIVMEVLAPNRAAADLSRPQLAKVDSVIEMVERRDGQFVPAGDVTLYTLLEAFTAYDAHRVPVRGESPEARQERRELNVIRGEGVANDALNVLRARL